MSRSHRRLAHAHPVPRRASGTLLVGTVAVVAAAFVLVPWLARRLTDWPPAPAAAGFVALLPALYAWFRLGQQAPRRTAAWLALVYAALAAGVLWWWQAR